MKLKIAIYSFLMLVSNCTKQEIAEGSDPNFKIEANNDSILSKFNRKVVVFGIDIYAVPKVSDEKLLYTANIMAQYLDNNEDGLADNQLVLDHMLEHKAYMVMWNKQLDLLSFPNGREGQDLGNDETNPNYVSSGKIGSFDAGLEEVLHLITHVGYANAYPTVFGEKVGTELANAMDISRGGQFQSIPKIYPDEAWYSYDDKTCDYSCMVTEYFYWSLTSILGAQENRMNEIQDEWRLETKEKVMNTDTKIFELLTNPQYKLPTIIPDGKYMR